jgi:hypothetical protein
MIIRVLPSLSPRPLCPRSLSSSVVRMLRTPAVTDVDPAAPHAPTIWLDVVRLIMPRRPPRPHARITGGPPTSKWAAFT